MTQPEPLVRFCGVQKTYDGKQLAVRNLNLDIQGGEFLSLLGPSGSGKTTTLMMLAGFESPSAGDIFLGRQKITSTAPHQRNFGVVFQNYALFPHLTVEQNVAYPLTVRKVPKAEQQQRVEQALAMVRLKGMGQRRPSQLSGGQQQRVALARALVFKPQLVLMDEPLGALDKQLREHMQIELKELHQQLGLTFIYVTHDQGEALTMSDRVAVFNDGDIEQLASAQTLYETPANRFVASFVGDSTLLNGKLHQDASTSSIVLDGLAASLRGINVNQCASGAAVQACVRPERIVLHRSKANQGNCISAVVIDSVYYGDQVRLLCDIGPSQPQATVKLALGTNNAHQPPPPGSAVQLEFMPEYTRIYAI